MYILSEFLMPLTSIAYTVYHNFINVSVSVILRTDLIFGLGILCKYYAMNIKFTNISNNSSM